MKPQSAQKKGSKLHLRKTPLILNRLLLYYRCFLILLMQEDEDFLLIPSIILLYIRIRPIQIPPVIHNFSQIPNLIYLIINFLINQKIKIYYL
jgi:hypothetical protein